MQNGFEGISANYDVEFTHTPIGRAQRNCVWRVLKKVLPQKPIAILEMNGGTGVDAAFLLSLGHKVTLTDGSPAMLKVAEQKLNNPFTSNLNIAEWNLKERFEKINITYDWLFSNFGGWNCLNKNELQQLGIECSHLLNPGGRLVVVVMGRKCLWEKWYFKFKKNTKAANRRLQDTSAKARLSDNHFVDTWYYTPKELRSLLPAFKLITQKPIGLFIPPSYFNPFFAKKQWLLKILVVLETCFAFSAWSNYADHYMLVLEKNA